VLGLKVCATTPGYELFLIQTQTMT
jgi:hypothetical protein